MPNPSTAPMPHYADLEKLILGVILVTESSSMVDFVSSQLSPSDFYIPSHRHIYESLLKIRKKGKTVNVHLLVNHLRDNNLLARVGDQAYIADLTTGIPHASDLSREAEQIKAASHRRYLIRLADTLEKKAFDTSQDIYSIIAGLQKTVSGISITTQSPIEAVSMTEVKAEKIEWLWEGRIPRRGYTIVQGMEGIGKSMFLCALAAAITNGMGLKGMNLKGPGTVLWLSAEDDLAQVLKPRLMAAEADCSKVFAIGQPFTLDAKGFLLLREQVAKHKPTSIFIDPLFAYHEGSPNTTEDVRNTTNHFKMICDDFDTSLLGVRHLGKSKGFGDPRAAGSGSIEWQAAARSVLLVGYDPDDRQKLAVIQDKRNNYGEVESIGYQIVSDDSSPSGARFFWTGISDLTAKRVLQNPLMDEDDQIEKKNVKIAMEEFLQQILQDGAKQVQDVENQARNAGLSVSYLKKMIPRLGIKATGRGFGDDKVWYYNWPNGHHSNGQNGHQNKLDFDRETLPAYSDISKTISDYEQASEDKQVVAENSPYSDNVRLSPGDLPGAYSDNIRVSENLDNNPTEGNSYSYSDTKPEISEKGDTVSRKKRVKKEPEIKTHCRECGAKLEPDGTCEICKTDMPF